MWDLRTINGKPCDVLVVDAYFCKNHVCGAPLRVNALNKKLLCLGSGGKALQYLKSLSRSGFPYLIILDYHLPDLNGKEILEHLKYSFRFSYIPVIIYSIDMTENLKSDLMELGAVSCLKKSKGMDMEDLNMFLMTLSIIFDEKAHQ